MYVKTNEPLFWRVSCQKAHNNIPNDVIYYIIHYTIILFENKMNRTSEIFILYIYI